MENLRLKTDRLDLIPFTKEDSELFLRINTDPYVRKFLWDDELIDAQLVEELLEENNNHFNNSGYGLWKISPIDSNTVVGYAGLWFFFDEPQPQLLYALLPEHSGNGYATEASKMIVDYSFETLGFDYLIASMDVGHDVSIKVAERLGFEFLEEKVIDGKPTLFYELRKSRYSAL